MATSKLNTLQIKNFTGVDRFTEGTEQKPDSFETIQNMFAPNPGELKSLSGVTKLNSSTMAGVGTILHTKFLDTPTLTGLTIIQDPTSSSANGPDSMAGFGFVPVAGANTWDIYVQGVGTGICSGTKYTVGAASATAAIAVTVPSLTSKTRSVNFWIGTSGDVGPALIWAGSMYRQLDGTFVTSTSITPPSAATPPTSLSSLAYPPGRFSATEGTGGGLIGGRTYYFGIAPSYRCASGSSSTFATTSLVTNVATTSALGSYQVMSKYLNNGNNKIDYSFGFLPFDMPTTTLAPVNTSMVIDKAIVFAGLTPEDMQPIGLGDGVAKPVNIGSTFINNIVADGTATNPLPLGDTIRSTYKYPVDTILYVSEMTITVPGLAKGQYCFVVSSIISGSSAFIKVSATSKGIPLNITVAAVGQRIEFKTRQIDGTMTFLPHSLNMQPVTSSITSTAVLPISGTGRYYSLVCPFYPRDSSNIIDPILDPSVATSVKASGIFYKDASLNDSLRYDLFAPFFQPSVDLSNVGWELTNPSDNYTDRNFSISKTKAIQSRLFGSRIWMVNGYNEPFYTNGHVLKSGIPTVNTGSNLYHRWPITKFIEFFKNKMTLTNSASNASYTQGYLEYSEEIDVSNFNYVNSTPRAVSFNSGDQSDVRGLNIYSQDLTSVGAASFLVIGKRNSISVWDGDAAKNPNQISKSTGLAGPNAYTLTKFGPVFIGSDNVYLFNTSQDVTPIGNNIRDIIRSLTDDQLYNLNCVFHDEDIKIGYASEVDINSELWLRVFKVSGGLNTVWTGPHLMKAYTLQTQIPFWNGEREYRISTLDANVYRRDDPGSSINDSLDIVRRLKINNLGLQSDHFLKLIQALNLHLRLSEDEDFTLSLEGEDGSQSIVVAFTASSSGNIRMLKQVQIPQRFLARVLTLTLENANNSDMSIYDLSLLFSMIRRRLLP